MIRIDALWLATTPIDMRMGTERLLARVVQVFGSVRILATVTDRSGDRDRFAAVWSCAVKL